MALRGLAIVLFFTWTMLFSCNALAQQGTTQPLRVETSQTSKHSEELAAAKEQITLLRAELDTTRRFQDSMLQTVYWSLGGILLIVGLLLGFGWFANFKVYERDKNALMAELDASLSKNVTSLESQIASKLSEASDLVSGLVDEKITASERKLSDAINSIKGELFEIHFKDEKATIDDINESPNIALTYALSLLTDCVRRGSKHVPDVLHTMLKLIDSGGKLTAEEITRVNQILDGLPPHYRTLTEKLRNRLVASDIF